MYPKTNTVSNGQNTVTRLFPEQRLKLALVATCKAEPVKELAIDTGISWRTLEDMKWGRRLCSLTNAVAIAAARPGSPLAAEMRAMLSGEAEANSPEQINRIINNLQRRGGGT